VVKRSLELNGTGGQVPAVGEKTFESGMVRGVCLRSSMGH